MLDSQHTHAGSQLPATPVPGPPKSLLASMGTRDTHTQCRQSTPIFNMKIKPLKNNPQPSSSVGKGESEDTRGACTWCTQTKGAEDSRNLTQTLETEGMLMTGRKQNSGCVIVGRA